MHCTTGGVQAGQLLNLRLIIIGKLRTVIHHEEIKQASGHHNNYVRIEMKYSKNISDKNTLSIVKLSMMATFLCGY
jgi:hypothetical protein